MTQDKTLNNPMNIKYNSRAVFTDPYDEYIFKLLVKLFALKKTHQNHIRLLKCRLPFQQFYSFHYMNEGFP